MPSLFSSRLTRAAAAWRPGSGVEAAVALLDSLLVAARGAELDAGAEWLAPTSPLGQLLAEAFDTAMSPSEWSAWSTPPADPLLRFAALGLWRSLVLEPFARRFDLALVRGGIMGPPAPHTPQPAVDQAKGIDAWQLYHAGELLQGLPLYKVVDAIIHRPPGAGVIYVWGSDRSLAVNDASN